ncbi:MAG: QcrA and Rieske domain-containing protein [Candidatus Aquicultorales bacterium]
MGAIIKRAADVTRREFLTWMTGISLGVTGYFALGTLAKHLTPPARSPEGMTDVGWLHVTSLDSLTVGLPRLVEYGDEWVFVVKKAGGELTALNAACPHVRCKLGWNAETKKFECPCHGSTFTIDGKRLFGPAPRDMYAMRLKVDKGNVVVGGYADV